MYPLIILSVFILAALAWLAFFQKKPGSGISVSKIFNADKAAEYCTDNRGTIETKQKGDGSSYEVCVFNGNRQCEKEAMENGECPLGGVSLSGYITDSSAYCAVLGGRYEKSNISVGLEKGTCSFLNGNICDADDLFGGKCDKGNGSFSLYQNDDYNFSLKIPKNWEGKYTVSNGSGADGLVYISFDYNSNGLSSNLFKLAVVPSSLWEKQSASLQNNYLSRDASHFFSSVYPGDKPSDQGYLGLSAGIPGIISTFEITKPYLFSETEKESGSNYSIEKIIPSIGAVNGKVDVAIASFVEGLVSDFKNKVGAGDAWQGENTFKVFYNPCEVNGNFVSIMFETEEYTGGAHPESRYYGFDYDLKNGKVLALADIFSGDYVKSISEKSIAYLSKLNQAQPFTNDEWISEGAGPEADNFKNFCLGRDNIVFYMNPYQVGAYAAGMQEVIMPLSSLKDILDKGEASSLGLD